MISITVNDPTRADAKVLRAIADALDAPNSLERTVSVVAGKEVCVGKTVDLDTMKDELKKMITPSTLERDVRTVMDMDVGSTTLTTIHPDDNPAAGAPDQHALADRVFSGGATHGPRLDALAGIVAAGPTAADVFSGGGIVPQGVTVLDIDAGKIVPNVPGTTPTPPPSPPATLPTLLPPLPGAPNVSLPPPPPPAPAPVAVSGAAPTTSAVQTDSTGLPWDGRIHASTKTMTAKNVWTRRRGVDDSVVAQVEAQLRAAMAVQAPAAAAVPPPPGESAPTFPTLMAFITERIGDGRLTQAMVTAAVNKVGLESLNLVMARVDLIPGVLAELQKVAP